VEIVGPTPRKPGDKVTLCVTGASITGGVGGVEAYTGKKIVINGRLEGTYCGEKPAITK
jgi:hypothetical protein